MRLVPSMVIFERLETLYGLSIRSRLFLGNIQIDRLPGCAIFNTGKDAFIHCPIQFLAFVCLNIVIQETPWFTVDDNYLAA